MADVYSGRRSCKRHCKRQWGGVVAGVGVGENETEWMWVCRRSRRCRSVARGREGLQCKSVKERRWV
uniref:Uncharacterized protein n=1 Tax=Helianthus annuus TaxID=4232 RepID=A0A251SG33_HELAN